VKKNLTKEVKWLIFGVPIIFLVSALLHFVYEWTGNIKAVGLFFPINESVWEHLKLLVLPIIIWWAAFYFVKGKALKLDKNRWFFGCLTSLLASMLFMLAFFYTYTTAFGVEKLALDIIDTFLSILFGQLLGTHIYKRTKGINWIFSVVVLAFIVAVFVIFTVSPPDLPIFFDNANGKFGF